MLDGLDDIPWHRLHHAYGTADDVPELLRKLALSGDKQADALWELYGNIWHQGTVYEASSYAVPFLVELAMEPTIKRRDEILCLIASLATGTSFLAVHAKPEKKTAKYWRQKPDFEQRLARELDDVHRVRAAVFQSASVIGRLLSDPNPIVRASAAHVLCQFPDHSSELVPTILRAAEAERDSLARAGMLWCLGLIRDNSSETLHLLETAIGQCVDVRQAYSAAIAWHRIHGRPHGAAAPLYRQLAAATWYADGFLAGLPFSGDIPLEPLLAGVEPDPVGATEILLRLLRQDDNSADLYPCLAYDLLALNFPERRWRECKQLSETQKQILRCLVMADAVWTSTPRLWFLVPNGAQKMSTITGSDIEAVRDEMRSRLE